MVLGLGLLLIQTNSENSEADSKPVAPECSCQGPTSEVPMSSVGSCQENAGTTGFLHSGTTKWFCFETTSAGVRGFRYGVGTSLPAGRQASPHKPYECVRTEVLTPQEKNDSLVRAACHFVVPPCDFLSSLSLPHNSFYNLHCY